MSLTIGQLQIDRVEEFCAAVVAPQELLSGLPDDAVSRHADWLLPDCIDPGSGRMITSVHSWLVRTRHHTILIDTCYGNDKTRPSLPAADHLDTPWLARLAQKGVHPDEVDFVMCTHLHSDHVGWNTQLKDGRWVPTFPNARYIFSRKEYEHWRSNLSNADTWGQGGVFEDSVLPCMEAGLVTLVEDGFSLDDNLMVEAAPGHTLGNAIIRARSQGSTGLFSGDCMHTPLQMAYPDVNTVVCEEPALARQTRRRILTECAEHGHLLLPAHFPPPFVCRVSAAGDAFRYHPVPCSL